MAVPKIVSKATIEKSKPMPAMCQLCSSYMAIPKTQRNLENPESNTCFETPSYQQEYKPFTNSRRKIILTCGGFSHIRSFVAW